MILKCKCDNKFQDKEYGEKMRVFNPLMKKTPTSAQEYRCTVCTAVRQ
jgi:hypothetical protein